MDKALTKIEDHMSFGGQQQVWRHFSQTLNCEMKFGVFLPAEAADKAPVLYWLSGLTCNEQNFITKAGAQQFAQKHGIILVTPDTSPRGEDVADSPDYDLGQGAGFYVDSRQQPWQPHYQMYSYIVEELPTLIKANFSQNDRKSISGHSMGGMGALQIGLKNNAAYCSVSAFAPISWPSNVAWGKKAFGAYLGQDATLWADYDPKLLVEKGYKLENLLVDQGLDDEYLAQSLETYALEKACLAHNINAQFRFHSGYDHSYYFVSNFIEDHIAFHARHLYR